MAYLTYGVTLLITPSLNTSAMSILHVRRISIIHSNRTKINLTYSSLIFSKRMNTEMKQINVSYCIETVEATWLNQHLRL